MADRYILERDGQIDFYKKFLPRINSTLKVEDILADNNDGVLNGNLIEFKLNIIDLNAALFQCIKYLSALRLKGKPVPFGVCIVDLNASIAWYYKSEDYLFHIEKLYTGGASKDNSGFIGNSPLYTLYYGNNQLDAEKLIVLLKEAMWTKIHIDENCIVGWATEFYSRSPMSRKEDFIGDSTGKHKTIGEIRKPRIFADYIHPYLGESNVRFDYLMDKLNDTLQKKNLGAFYTPVLYAQKSVELVRQAIARIPAGNDYVILDRCAGTGILERQLSDEELSHCIVSTVEYYEYKILQELIGSKVLHVIPPYESAETFNSGLVSGADALSKEYIDNPVIKRYIDDPKFSIILFENPPYAETTSAEHQKRGVGAKSSATWKTSYVVDEMKRKIRGKVKGSPANDIGNAFIWSGFEYYLRQPTDSYVVFSPVKYWKTQHLVEKSFLKGFAFNRRHFHTSIDACIMCALWANSDDTNTKELSLAGYDIVDDALKKYPKVLPVKRINKIFSEVYYDKRTTGDSTNGIAAALNGLEFAEQSRIRVRKAYNDDIVGYMVANGSNFDNPDINTTLLRVGQYNGNGFYLRKDNYLEKLPLFAAGRYITYNREWTERARIMKSADGAHFFARDFANGKLKPFLLKCLLFTCLEMQNHIRTFRGSDGRFYRNEICLDDTNGATIASLDLLEMQQNESEKMLFKQWNTVLRYAKQTKKNERSDGYIAASTYGVYQIFAELDTSYRDEITDTTVWDNKELHSALIALKGLLVAYYNSEIVPVLFKYEFLK